MPTAFAGPAAAPAVRADRPAAAVTQVAKRPCVDGKLLARDGRRFRACGVTYGPFRPNDRGEPFPEREQVQSDFRKMIAAGINSVRTYHVPPEWLLELADSCGITLFIDVPWPKHLCFLDSQRAQAEARALVRAAAARGLNHPSVLAYSIGNEIPPNVARWHGTRCVQRFLAELRDVSKQADPDGLVTYASFPSTEYLDLSGFDLATFNVYLHDPEVFRRYILRLQNLIGDVPLVLGEIGMDTLRHGETEQAGFLAGHLREAMLLGVAGTFVFSWTDDWFTGGYQIENWAFGITRADRTPKAACPALREVFEAAPAQLLTAKPSVSVVVCSYNGGSTLEQCLRSLCALDYPDFEVIVVDDGSTDNTPAIVARFPDVRSIRQTNRGLSAARNVGLHEATGEIVAYTDSDCFADRDWLTLLVERLEESGAAAVGGPNLTPEDGWLAACVAASPGQPTHVLESDQEAEHIPGCNMAFRRDALLTIHGFDPVFRKAGDDVDICWRLQQAGQWITFAPGAFVWHHRRQGPRAYLKQQAGYGEAEALLRFKHPARFNGRGDGKWRGVLYGAALQGVRLGGPIIYRGTFATGLFQCIYQRGPAHWAMLPTTLEWHVGAALLALAALHWLPALFLGGAMIAASVLLALVQAAQARIATRHDGRVARLVIAVLCYVQPLVRSWKRYRTRLQAYRRPTADPQLAPKRELMPFLGSRVVQYWSETGHDRTELLDRAVAYFTGHRWGLALDAGWSDWDVAVHCDPGLIVQVCTAQEDHHAGKRLLRVRYRLRPGDDLKTLALASAAAFAAGTLLGSWAALAGGTVLLAVVAGLWWHGRRRAGLVAAAIDAQASQMGLVRCRQNDSGV
jgi:GT2 family glycosyltransferase